MVEWQFTVKQVTQDKIVFNEAPTATAFSGNRLYIYFDKYEAPGYLPIGKSVPPSFAEKLRMGDQLSIKGKASVDIGTKVGPFRSSWVNDYIIVAIYLSEVEVHAKITEQERERQDAEEEAAEVMKRHKASRGAVVQKIQQFLSKGSVFSATYFSHWPNYHSNPNLHYQITITGDMKIWDFDCHDHHLNQKVEIPAHFKWLGDTESLVGSGWGFKTREYDGTFLGEVNELDNVTGGEPGWRVTIKYRIIDRSIGPYCQNGLAAR